MRVLCEAIRSMRSLFCWRRLPAGRNRCDHLSPHTRRILMAVENIIGSWKEVRSGLIDEAEQIPADKFSFQATPDTRSVAKLLQHIIEAQKLLVAEACRPDTNLLRQSFADQVKSYAPGVSEVNDKD